MARYPKLFVPGFCFLDHRPHCESVTSLLQVLSSFLTLTLHGHSSLQVQTNRTRL